MLPPRLVFFTQAFGADVGFGAEVVGVDDWETSPSSISVSSTAEVLGPADIIGAGVDVEDDDVEGPEPRLLWRKSTE